MVFNTIGKPAYFWPLENRKCPVLGSPLYVVYEKQSYHSGLGGVVWYLDDKSVI